MARTGLLCVLLLTLPGCEDRAEALLGKGNALAARGSLQQAAKSFEEAARLLPADSRPFELLGNVRLELREPAPAKAAFEKALELNPSSVEALIGLGRIEGRTGALDQAIDHLTLAVEAAPDRVEARSWRAVFLVARGGSLDLELSLKDVEHALSVRPNDPASLYIRGNALLALHRYDDARASFEELSRAAPSSALADYGLARLAAAQGDRLGALAQLRQAQQKSKDDPQALPKEDVRKDPAFRFLEDDPDFAQLIPR